MTSGYNRMAVLSNHDALTCDSTMEGDSDNESCGGESQHNCETVTAVPTVTGDSG